MTTTTTRGRSFADVRSAADNRRTVALALADLPDETLDPATLDGFEFGAKVLMAAAEAAVQSETYVNVRTFAHRLHREFCSGRLTPFALGVTLACSRVRYSAAHR
jgi:hypothetical protein